MCEVGRLRLGLWAEPGDRDLFEAVPLREIGECLVTRDDFAALAVRQALAVFGVEIVEPRNEPRGRVLGPESRADPLDDLRVAQRVEPDMRIPVGKQVEPRGVEEVEDVSPLPEASSSCGWKPWPRRRTSRASRTVAASMGESSRSCGSAPGGVRFSTGALGAISFAANASG